jgi:hypothetical protein
MSIPYTILFPSEYYDKKVIDEAYAPEYQAVCKLPELRTVLYNHDKFVYEDKLDFYPAIGTIDKCVCVCRTWMLNPDQYNKLFCTLAGFDIKLINTPGEYNKMHLFPYVYPDIQEYTPRAIFFDDTNKIEADIINSAFNRFMIKDYVKSVKGYDFPQYFDTPVSQDNLKEYITRFIELRGSLFTGGIVFKEYVSLKKYGNVTNEYRVFYLNGNILTVSPNSNQPGNSPYVPYSLAESFCNLPSNYYTVDFGELEDGSFIILETGDGQVSGLSPNQDIFKYYNEFSTKLSKCFPLRME